MTDFILHHIIEPIEPINQPTAHDLSAALNAAGEPPKNDKIFIPISDIIKCDRTSEPSEF